jgi:hypothetical protein
MQWDIYGEFLIDSYLYLATEMATEQSEGELSFFKRPPRVLVFVLWFLLVTKCCSSHLKHPQNNPKVSIILV